MFVFMNTERAVKLLSDCEASLRRLGANALTSGDYDDADRISDWARAIRAMTAPSPMTSRDGNGNGTDHSVADRRERKGAKASEYPKFFRRGDELVKVGWSKKGRREYHHRAPRQAVDALTSTVKQAGARGKIFTSDDVLPQLKGLSGGDDSAIPPYQGYLALAWLKHLGLVEQHGRRGGYALVPDRQFDDSIESAWNTLTNWRG